MRLKDKVAIITGAGRGIGAATAIRFAEEGAKVVIASLFENEVEETVNKIIKNGGEAIGITVDVTDKQQVDTMVRKTLDAYRKLDIIVNNAGITADGTLVKMTEENFDKVIDVNLKGVYNCGQAAAKVMVEQGKGVILNATSVVGLYGNYGQTNYAATKWGVIGMTKTWAKELGKKGVRVNAVAPGFILTPMTESMPEKVLNMMRDKAPVKRLGLPEDIANAYLYLASDEATYVTGSVLEVSGGIVL
ncbi:3-oxoacyl-ACP reductase FabG [Vallitalea guaymasensis]|uniref:3-oxoacyl-[acyl-carrier-protein] reductase n=1 Tax=Vallitalea guaymasensis TaxID=1185412 RepID=A0A8J8ME41_9FIRM|nr:3-oxoacyl-ACP reductase FabG [Vallitalea guaymasensis]QUH31236.1 3-oxoacyl-ACP reductase FabG [Vallitalea guaymasensis]